MNQWTWTDAMEHFREETQGTTTFEFLRAMSEQVEANRLAIQELQREYRRRVHDTAGMSRYTNPPE